MQSYHELINRFKHAPEPRSPGKDPVHASLAAYPGRLKSLKLAIESLVDQVDTLHVFLNDFMEVPGFLDHEKIYITRSQDFGNLGECGKYYWTDDLDGYHFICSDRLTYPVDYVERMKAGIEEYGRKTAIGAGGYSLTEPFLTFQESAAPHVETDRIPADIEVPLLNDLALCYHTSTIRVSRHYFYQPGLSAFWFSIIALEQGIPLICLKHEAGWLAYLDSPGEKTTDHTDPDNYKAFLIRSYFCPPENTGELPVSTGINSFFDRIYVMNLDRRPDRWQKIALIAKKHNLDITRFAAVDGTREQVKAPWEKYFRSGLKELPAGIEPLTDYRDKFQKYFHYAARIHFMESKLGKKAMQSPGAWGYAMSYIAILNEAIKNDYHRILILDDDIILHKNFNKEFEKHALHLPVDWKLIMLGAMQHRWEPYITPDTELFYHCHGSSVASHAVGIDRKVFLQLLYYSEKLDLPIDEGAVFHIQNVYDKNCYIFLPNIAIQELAESDINTSVMKQQDIADWMKRFRWKTDDYDIIRKDSFALHETLAGVKKKASIYNYLGSTKMNKIDILIAGHDLKFLTHVINHFKGKENYRLKILTYKGHVLTESDELLKELPQFDILFSEWGLGNLKWFSENKLPWQKLITRIHLQEFATPFLAETNWANVDNAIVVGPFMKERFDSTFPESAEKCLVILNLIDTVSFDLKKEENANFNLGMLGILPMRKAPHIGLEILRELHKTDNRYKLYIKSKRPEELDWLWKRPEEQLYYEEFYRNIEKMGLKDAVVLEPHGSDVTEWYRHIGFIISPSEFESFHMSIPEGMASGTIPVIRNWEGAKALYPDRLIFANIKEAVNLILSYADPEKYLAEGEKLKKYCRERFSLEVLLPEYEKIMLPDPERQNLQKEYDVLEILKDKLAEEQLMNENEAIREAILDQIRQHQEMINDHIILIKKVHLLKAELASNTETNFSLKTELEQFKTEHEQLKTEHEQLKTNFALNLEVNNRLQSEVDQLNTELKLQVSTNRDLNAKLNDIKNELKESHRRLEVIQNSLSWKVGSTLIGKPVGLIKGLGKKGPGK